MAISDPDGRTSVGEEPSILKLPEQVDGFIDLKILMDIHKCLNASNSDEDLNLGIWVRTNYLQEPLKLFEEKARPIRDAEGFVNLSKAYRRARLLTGKAQDQWPFYNKDLKKLSSTIVKSLGNSAMNFTRSPIGGAVHDTPMSVGLEEPQGNALCVPVSRASLSGNQFGANQAQKLKSTQLADRHLDQHEPRTKPRRQDDSPISKTSSMAGECELDGTDTDTLSSTEALRDAASLKVRGSNGRYVTRDTRTLPEKKQPGIKYVKKSRARAASEGEREEVDESEMDPLSSESRDKTFLDSDKSPGSTPSAVTIPNDLPVSAILAAEAEAIPSNLDRLPPGNTNKKRKNDPNDLNIGLKRTRGTRGGLLGRPRKSETPSDRAKLEPGEIEGMQADDQASQPISIFQTPAAISSRRSSRKSATSAMESAAPWDPAEDVLLSSVSQKQHHRDYNTTFALSDGNDDAAYAAGTSRPSSVGQKAKSPAKNAVDGPRSAPTVRDTAIHAKVQTKFSSTKQKKRVSFSPDTQACVDNVEFFARITTAIGTQEVPLLKDDLIHELDLIERFAAWQTAGNAPVSFEVFKNIVRFARPS